MDKYIHYCWFGGKKMPRKFKKYIRTWKKYMPDYKIMEWNENNFDINITKFSKEAYESKKWAFVSDVARIYALKEYGGVYFDTDIEVTKKIDNILNNSMWFGREDENYLASAMFGVKEKNNKHINNIFNIYKKAKFNKEDLYSVTSPKIITNYFRKLGLTNVDENQVLEDDIHIYKKEYFNPKSYDGSNETFSKNTCIVHHFDATWTSIDEKVAIWFVRRRMGSLAKPTFAIFRFLRKVKHKIKKIFRHEK
ncbi:putative uncharacterized protein [Clostridium sp. CAG:762]|nr:putative uncharacterized protein [Clostridium sp. CAG:762]